MGRFIKKRPADYFKKFHFPMSLGFLCGGVPNRFRQKVEMDYIECFCCVRYPQIIIIIY